MSRIILIAAMGSVALLKQCVTTAEAQYDIPQQPQVQLQQLPIIDLKGTIEEVGADLLSIKCEGQAFLLKIAPNYTRVQVSGTADKAYLKPGVLVRFEGEFDKKGQAKAPLEELCVVTPSETNQPGIHADAPLEGEGPRAAKRGGSEIYLVVGTIKLIKDNQLQVVADGKPIKVQLAKEIEVKVEIDDHTLAEAGDEITVRGRTVQPPQGQQPGQVYGEDVTITLAQPLEATSKAPAKKKKTAKPVKRGR